MRAVDTNVLVRLVARDDPQQAVLADTFIEQGAWISILALAETVWVLATSGGRNPAELVIIIQMLLDHKQLTIQYSDAVADALDLFRAKPSLGFSDCLILQLARTAGHMPLGTFDRGLAKVEGTYRL